MLDTGAAGWGTLDTALFDSLAAAGNLQLLAETVTLASSGGDIPSVRQGRLKGMSINGNEIPEAIFVRATANRLGWHLFRSFNWQFDLSRSEIAMIPRLHRKTKEVPVPSPPPESP